MNRFFLTSIFSIICFFSNGQINLGAKLGLNRSVFRFDNFGNQEFKFGLNTGFLINIPINKKFFTQAEILYSQKGYKFETDLYNGELNLNYFNLPVLMGLRVSKKLSLIVGPEFGHLFSQEYNVSNGLEFRKGHREFDMGISIGGSFNFSKNIGIDLRYTYGIIKAYDMYITDSSGTVIGSEYLGNNRTYQLNIFYLFAK